jgi:hypothetical protein
MLWFDARPLRQFVEAHVLRAAHVELPPLPVQGGVEHQLRDILYRHQIHRVASTPDDRRRGHQFSLQLGEGGRPDDRMCQAAPAKRFLGGMPGAERK